MVSSSGMHWCSRFSHGCSLCLVGYIFYVLTCRELGCMGCEPDFYSTCALVSYFQVCWAHFVHSCCSVRWDDSGKSTLKYHYLHLLLEWLMLIYTWHARRCITFYFQSIFPHASFWKGFWSLVSSIAWWCRMWRLYMDEIVVVLAWLRTYSAPASSSVLLSVHLLVGPSTSVHLFYQRLLFLATHADTEQRCGPNIIFPWVSPLCAFF